MDNKTRLQYLEVMGIDVWVPRQKVIEGELSSSSSYKDTASNGKNNGTTDLSEEWNVLQKIVSECSKCALCETRTQTVFGVGNQNADWMFVGESPGHNEDVDAIPFLGKTGQLLDEMIRAIGLGRDSVYITNILKCKTPENRNPKVEEVQACRDYLQQQILLVKPKIILAVGRVAIQTLLETKEPLTKLRGVSHQLAGIPVVAIYHPAYLLRSLLEKKKAWQDLQLAMKQIKKQI